MQAKNSNLIFNKDFSQLNTLLEENYSDSIKFILVDQNTHDHCILTLDQIGVSQLEDAEILLVPDGEGSKSPEIAISLWQALMSHNADRHAVLINLGGGMVTDLGGFIASTYKRGIDFINIPTSLLAMVDASIGGKTGINLDGVKNQVGTFNDPVATFLNTDFLQTLPQREFMSGWAEVYKHALIDNGSLFEEIQKIESPSKEVITTDLLKRIIAVKQQVVQSDPFEKSERQILNLGHTIGHAVETAVLGSDHELLHGEAVAAGIVIENFIAEEKNLLDNNIRKNIQEKLKSWYPDVFKLEFRGEALTEIALADKKNTNQNIRCSLLEEPGKVKWGVEVNSEDIESAIKQWNAI
ncbi:3-dehydroquinate synthase [Salibacter sp.]|uniref:3-dehydroquinate synthase n=1 Tax=Salibacter sp. TaxID=2010995 RepID=UPI002870AA92|nr:3-dehydroquinate synthase [Salibacter sp.]MDR9487810.1 3-dehydroquinate synthase [Salibacter sp.]